ncbi:heterokaryon incompatibility protein-domain-containing protein [Xylariaceae sp. AK1471]|nr:heterokaryon incompatibility protein-domain-containing protein [Xylariaceae sp. AK1471]
MAFIRNLLLRKKDEDSSDGLQLPSSESTIRNVEQFVTRSLSTRARRLTRQVSSIRTGLCASCRNLDFGHISQTLNNPRNPDGLFLGWLSDNLIASKCPLCQILTQACIETCHVTHDVLEHSQVSPRPLGSKLQLRAFQLLPHLPGPQYQKSSSKSESCNSDYFIAAVPNHFPLIPGGPNEAMIKDMVSKRGFLVYHDNRASEDRLLTPRLVSTSFDPVIVQGWLQDCRNYHTGCHFERRPDPSLNLIDCRNHRILSVSDINSDSEPEYVALSYVWGNCTDVSKVMLEGHTLPSTLPSVVKDSIQVTLRLGYYYLWVDKYCVDNKDKIKKHEQLMHMDSVYKNAALTIVAAAGLDESYGLPGLSKNRPSRQMCFRSDNFTLISTLPLPHDSIAKSCWATRGWTYQEAILSRRRLVFTDDQLYFECNSTSCCESFDVLLDKEYVKSKPGPENDIQPSLFTLKQLSSGDLNGKVARLSNLFTYVHCAEQYSQRTLRFDHDSLTAFSGIIRMLESFTAFPVRHIWGIPFFHPDDDSLYGDVSQSTYQTFKVPLFWKTPALGCSSSAQKASSDVEGVDYVAFLMLGLGWRHNHSSKPPRRRNNLPSWSWTGWEGSVGWPTLDQNSDVRILPWTKTSISFGDSTTESVPTIYHKTTDAHLLAQSNKSLYVRTLAISRTAFVLDESSSNLLLSTGSKVRLYPSKSDLDASKVFKRIQSARYEVIILATVDEKTYMMLIKRYRNSYYRIGTMAANTRYLTIPLFTSNIKTYKLR